MAAFKYSRNQADKLSVTGIIDETATTITYDDKDAGEIVLRIQDLIDAFASQEVTLSLSTKNEQELYLPDGEE